MSFQSLKEDFRRDPGGMIGWLIIVVLGGLAWSWFLS